MEHEPQPLNLKQREQFARLLERKRKQKAEELESDYKVEKRVESEFLPKLAKEKGAGKLIERIQQLDKELDDTMTTLSDQGFYWDDYHDEISLTHDAPESFSDALAETKRSAREERLAPLKEFDRAILNVWAADDAQDAKKIVEDLL